jgi:hypothetical protein
MKKFTTAEITDLLNQVYREEISFSRMVEMINERVDEKNEPQYKDGDFVVDEVGGILIFRKKVGDSIYNHAYFYEPLGVVIIAGLPTWPSIKRLATEEEKQELHDAIAKEGKRWDEEKKCVEDIPEKPKRGDLAIFWDNNKRHAIIRVYKQFRMGAPFPHQDCMESRWINAIKFESKEQFEKLIKGEI